MFTGIIEATAAVLKKTEDSLTIAHPVSLDDLKKGCSIAVSGACLTVTSFDDQSMTFQVIPETWQKTKLGSLTKGDLVNLERSMPASGRFDGHIVQGHIEGVGTVTAIVRDGQDVRVMVSVADDLRRYIIPKGSITIDGIALTVASIEKDQVTVALIPETLQMTTFSSLREGDMVNLETDMIGRYVYALLPRA